jgi:hypothetical protein
VWKTTDYGRTWTPIFDDQPTGSIGAIAVAHVAFIRDGRHWIGRWGSVEASGRVLPRGEHALITPELTPAAWRAES